MNCFSVDCEHAAPLPFFYEAFWDCTGDVACFSIAHIMQPILPVLGTKKVGFL